MKHKLSVPWTARLTFRRLFQWRGKGGRTNPTNPNLLKEDDLDHLGEMHSATAQPKKR